ncbi:MAG: Nif11-like leader peptide family RiPP precursor [Pseudomonadota bacterium]
MTVESLKAFVAQARDDNEIKEAIRTATSPDDIVALGAKAGHQFSTDELMSTEIELAKDDVSSITVRRVGFRVHPFGSKHWFGWK